MIIPSVLAILIPLLFLYCIAALDVRTQKRRRLLITAFVWGIIAFTIAYIIFTALVNNRILTLHQIVSVGAPLTEELLKAGCLFILARKSQIRSAVDGAEFGFAIGTGFAIVENLLYLASTTPEVALETSLARVLSTNLMHGMATGLVGAAIGSNYYRSRRVLQVRTALALLLAASIHVIFNQIVLYASGVSLVAIAIVFGLSGLALLLFVITLAMNAERDWIESQLQQDGVPAGERMAIVNPGLFAELLAKQKIGLDENQMKLLNEYVQLRGEKALLTRKISLNEHAEIDAGLQQQEFEITRKLDRLSREMGFYLRMIVRVLLPSAEDNRWIVLSKELGLTTEPLIQALVMMGERQSALSNKELLARRRALDHSPLFNVLLPAELDDISILLDQVVVTTGENVEIQGHYDGRLFIVAAGKLEAHVVDAFGVETTLAIYTLGDTFGELSLIDLKPHPMMVSAIEDSLLYTLSRDQFITLIAARPQVNFRLLKEMSAYIRDQTELITLVRYLGVKNLPAQVTDGKTVLPRTVSALPGD